MGRKADARATWTPADPLGLADAIYGHTGLAVFVSYASAGSCSRPLVIQSSDTGSAAMRSDTRYMSGSEDARIEMDPIVWRDAD